MTQDITADRLWQQLRSFSMTLNADIATSVIYRRIARFYTEFMDGGDRIPTGFVIKPNETRYWTRSAAMRDADDIAADIFYAVSQPGVSQPARKVFDLA